MSELTQVQLLERIAILNDLIAIDQVKFNRGVFRSPEAAIRLQKLRREREALRAQLDPLTLAWRHPKPHTLPEREHLTRNEVRALMGLPSIEDEV